MYSEGSLPRAGSRNSLTGDYEPFRYGPRQARSLKRTQSFQVIEQCNVYITGTARRLAVTHTRRCIIS